LFCVVKKETQELPKMPSKKTIHEKLKGRGRRKSLTVFRRKRNVEEREENPFNELS